MPHPLFGCVLRYYLDDFCITHHPITSGTEDEFDVFMDSLIRRISIKMLVSHIFLRLVWNCLKPVPQIDTAKAAHGKQYILITPQDIPNVFVEPPVVKISQMADPRS